MILSGFDDTLVDIFQKKAMILIFKLLKKLHLAKMKLHEDELKSKWQEHELFWQKELGTMWPFGLNDHIKHIGNVSKNY